MLRPVSRGGAKGFSGADANSCCPSKIWISMTSLEDDLLRPILPGEQSYTFHERKFCKEPEVIKTSGKPLQREAARRSSVGF